MKKRKPRIIKDKKTRGEWAEMRFMACAAEHGLTATKPWGESRSYDFIVGRPGHFVTVQVKSTANPSEGGYVCHVGAGCGRYAARAFDFAAVYVVPDDVWYIIPETKIRGMQSISVYPRSSEAKYELYREAWRLLREASGLGEQTSTQGAACDTEEPTEFKIGGIHPAGASARMQAVFNTIRYRLEDPNGFAKKGNEER